ncbi:MAG: YkgJ family cysteine cluster protein [Candidatus Micrarchaeota archaeon]
MLNPCSMCPAHCCKSYTITLTAFDVLRAMQATARPFSEFAVLHQARLLAFDPDTTLDMEDDSWVYILGFKSHPCVFLGKDNLCTIHENAPMSCRRYPFQLDGKLNTRFCPLPSQLVFRLKGADIRTEPLVRELEAYKKIVKEWNRKPGKLAECIPFLLKMAEAAEAGLRSSASPPEERGI